MLNNKGTQRTIIRTNVISITTPIITNAVQVPTANESRSEAESIVTMLIDPPQQLTFVI